MTLKPEQSRFLGFAGFMRTPTNSKLEVQVGSHGKNNEKTYPKTSPHT